MGLFDDIIGSKPAAPPPDYGGAIASIESGGKYDILGPVTKTGDRAYGKYQIMGANIGPWSRAHFGQELTPEQFLADPKAQDAIFNGQFGQYVQKYGPNGAARAWFAGEGGMNNLNAKDQLGTTVAQYGQKFDSALGPGAQITVTPSLGKQPEQKQAGGLFADIVQSAGPVAERFGDFTQPENAAPLRAGLEQLGSDMTTGPRASPGQQMAIEHANILPAASQGITPNMGVLRKGGLLSTETLQRDDGAILFRDPQTGQVVETDNTKHAVIRDPVDGVVKVYAKTDAVTENAAVGAARTLAPGFLTGAPTKAMNVSQRVATVPTVKQLEAAAVAGYNAPAVKELVMKTDEIVPIIDRVKTTLSEMGLAQPNAKTTWEILEQAVKAPKPGELPPGTQAIQTGVNIKALRSSLTEAAKTPGTSDGKAAMTAKGIIDEMLPAANVLEGDAAKVVEILKTADQNYSAMSDAKMLADRTYRAELRASSANSGMNTGNTIKQRLTDILTTPKLRRGLTEEQIKLAERVVNGNKFENTLRLVGNALGGGGGGAAALSGAVGGTAAAVSTGDPTAFLYGALLPAGGLTMRAIGNKITLNQADKLAQLLRSDSPLGKQMANPVKEWETAVKEFSQERSARNIARLNIASRNLSSNLKDAGIAIPPGDLLRSIAAHPSSAADEEKRP